MFVLFWECECFTCVAERVKAGRANDNGVLVIWVGCRGTAKLVLNLFSVDVSHVAYDSQ